jgi:ADP-ribose pyrophosphatase YjhB (NUDIX family)
MEVNEAFRYCPRCGSQGTADEHMLACPECGLHTYFNPKPAQSLILKNDKDEYLFVVRSAEPRKGYLDFPGGFAEAGEDFEQTSRRELKEELGIEVGRLKYLSAHADEYLYQGVNYKVSGVSYTAELPKNAELTPADDVSGVEFYKLKNVPMDRLAWPSMREMIAKLKQLK